eukprot:4649568-Pyramimonas_sp.AAC.1
MPASGMTCSAVAIAPLSALYKIILLGRCRVGARLPRSTAAFAPVTELSSTCRRFGKQPASRVVMGRFGQ